MTDANQTLLDVLEQHSNADKWAGKPFEKIKLIPNTKVGDVGQDFVEALCAKIGLSCTFPKNPQGKRSRNNDWDILINGCKFELKTASEDTNGSFQFNHIRHHRHYDAVLCIGISPGGIHVGAWTKSELATGKAGNLVTMDKGSSATFKLTKRKDKLFPIDEFKNVVRDTITKSNS